MKKVYNYVKNNKLFLSYVICNLITSTLLRFFTLKNYYDIKPMDPEDAKLILKETPSEDLNNIYIVKKGDTLYSIANKYNTSVDLIKISSCFIIYSALFVFYQIAAPFCARCSLKIFTSIP